ncbi:phage regulatory CII family protein [Pseudomonas sp. EA_35y_Pfl2_R5]|uniref:phage regulatory CII family protein n=1 Tax=Pseudomonas sp. EA_35y_Pfl2_R5 TaxID=3088690 RepID=UPI0030DAFB3C
MSRLDLLPGAGPVLSLRHALYRVGRDHKGGIGALAIDMLLDPVTGYDTLQKKLNPTEDRRWPNPDELEDIIRLTDDPRLLDALMRPADAVWFKPVPVTATNDALKALAELMTRQAEFVGSLHDGSADNHWKPHEVEALKHHGHEAIRKILGIIAGAEQAMEGEDDGVSR